MARRVLSATAFGFGLLAIGGPLLVSSCGQTYGEEIADTGTSAPDTAANGSDLDAADATDVPADGSPDATDAQPLPFATCALAEAGPDLIPIDGAGYCIDATEVTVGQYRAFLTAKAGKVDGQPAGCTNTTLAPANVSLPGASEGKEQLPIRQVDWCDAATYCAWAGKKLCGSIGSSATLPRASGQDSSKSQWYRACTHNSDGTRTYFYDNSFNMLACNSFMYPLEAGADVFPVGSLATCAGNPSTLRDFLGNVNEWEDSCAVVDGGKVCSTRGGNYKVQFAASCTASNPVDPTLTSPFTGFRCCSK